MSQTKTPPMSPVAAAHRTSMSVRRRLSSAAVVMSSGNNKDALLEATRQRYEDKKRRISIVSPKALRPEKAVPDEKVQQPAAAVTFDLLSPDDATEHYRQCLRLAIENKINKKNAFDLKLIENLETIVAGKNRQNFALCASLVDVGTRIFGSRVDANDIELKRICTWLCSGSSAAKEGEVENDKDEGMQDANYGGNDSVLAEMKVEEKKKAKSHSRKAVIEQDNNKLTAPIEKRSKVNPLMRGRRSARSAGGISEGLASVLLLPSLPVMERPLTDKSTTLNYVVSEAADRQFVPWLRTTSEQAPRPPNESENPRWPIEELEKLDLTKEICPPLHALDLNKTFGTEFENINSTATGIDDISCEEALHSKTHINVDSMEMGFGSDDNVRIIAPNRDNENNDDDSFEMPALEDQSICNAENQHEDATNQDCMLLVPMDDTGGIVGAQPSPSSLPFSAGTTNTFSIEQLHDVLAKSLATADGNHGTQDGTCAGVAPSWLLEQLVNGTVGKALKGRHKAVPVNDSKQAPTTKSRRVAVKVQKVGFSEELHEAAEKKLGTKILPKSAKKKPSMNSITGENDLPEPVVNHEFDELLRKLRDCFITGSARTARSPSAEGITNHNISLDEQVNDDGDDYAEAVGDEPSFFVADMELSGVGNKSLSRHEALIMERNLGEGTAEEPMTENQISDEVVFPDTVFRVIPTEQTELLRKIEMGLSGNAIGQMLLKQVRNASASLAASLLTRRVDVQVAKVELWRSVEQHAPASNMNSVVSTANDRLVESSKARSSKSATTASTNTLSPQMAFVCLLHLANEHNLTLQSGMAFSDIDISAIVSKPPTSSAI